jgi:hypothetical protein
MHHFFRFLNQTQLCFLACCLLPFPIWTSFEDSLFMSKELGYINRQDYIIFIEVGLFLETGLYARLAGNRRPGVVRPGLVDDGLVGPWPICTRKDSWSQLAIATGHTETSTGRTFSLNRWHYL